MQKLANQNAQVNSRVSAVATLRAQVIPFHYWALVFLK